MLATQPCELPALTTAVDSGDSIKVVSNLTTDTAVVASDGVRRAGPFLVLSVVLELPPLRPVVDGFVLDHQPTVSANRLVYVRSDAPTALRVCVVVVPLYVLVERPLVDISRRHLGITRHASERPSPARGLKNQPIDTLIVAYC